MLAGLWLLLSLAVTPTYAAETFSLARAAVYFSPNGGATDAVVRELNAAQAQVMMQAYSFTSAPIAGWRHAPHASGKRKGHQGRRATPATVRGDMDGCMVQRVAGL